MSFRTLNYACPGNKRPAGKRTALEMIVLSLVLGTILFFGVVVVLPKFVGRSDGFLRSPDVRDFPALRDAIADFKQDTGRLPTSAEGLDALRSAPADLPGWQGPYIAHPARDPWGNLYRYRRRTETSYEVRSAGPDQEFRTADDFILAPPAPTGSTTFPSFDSKRLKPLFSREAPSKDSP